MAVVQGTLFDAERFQADFHEIPEILGLPVNTQTHAPDLLRIYLKRHGSVVLGISRALYSQCFNGVTISQTVENLGSEFTTDEQYDGRFTTWDVDEWPNTGYVEGFLHGLPYVSPRRGGVRMLSAHLFGLWDDIEADTSVVPLEGISSIFRYPTDFARALSLEDVKASNGDTYRDRDEVRRSFGAILTTPVRVF